MRGLPDTRRCRCGGRLRVERVVPVRAALRLGPSVPAVVRVLRCRGCGLPSLTAEVPVEQTAGAVEILNQREVALRGD